MLAKRQSSRHHSDGEARSFGSFALLLPLGGMEGTSSDTEDGRFSDEEGEHNVENFMLCSFAHHARSPLLQDFLHEAV